MRSFTISTNRVGAKRWWLVRLHSNLEDLRNTAHVYRPWEARPDEALAICQPSPRTTGFAGVLRFVPECMNGEILAHELVHATAAVFRAAVSADGLLGATCGEAEEAFAYIYGELYQSLVDRLHAC